MIEIRLDETTQVLLYKQIAEQVRQFIAAKQLQAGEHLPTVRQLAQSLHLNPGTVVRAYLELEKEGLVVSRRGGGTVVSAGADNPMLLVLRQKRLSDMVSNNILDALTSGYSPEEIEALFHMHLDRWREERSHKSDIFEPQELFKDRDSKADSWDTIIIVGSHDLALSILLSRLKYRNPEINIDVTYAGSLGGLIALQREKADLAGIHLLDEETGEYNYPYVKHILAGREVAIVHLVYRVQGLMFAKGNPKQVKEIEDLRRSDITFINRQKGSGTRLLLDLELKQRGIQLSEVKGYKRETDTHLAVAVSIARGEADVGLGIEAAARARDLGFLPLLRERYDLVIPMENYRSKLLSPLLDIIRSEDFKKVVDNVGGYDTSQTGTTTFCR
jgi:molybdate-binding protein/DNA-binding transcriptional regulator YhcF (GntR family)